MSLKQLAKRTLPEPLVRVGGERWRRLKRFLKRQRVLRYAPRVTPDELSGQLRDLGIREGDLVIVWSSLSRLGHVTGGPDGVIQALLGVIGETGTLVMPTFNVTGGMLQQISSGVPFDRERTPTTLGIISEVFRRRPGVVRSLHVTHSLAASGPLAEELMRDHERAETTFGRGSPFVRLLERNAWCLGLGVSVAYPTFYHTYEDLHDDFPRRTYLPDAHDAPYIDANGERQVMRLRVHDPTLSQGRIDHRRDLQQRFLELFLERGILQQGKVGQSESWLMRSQDFMRVLDELTREGITIYADD